MKYNIQSHMKRIVLYYIVQFSDTKTIQSPLITKNRYRLTIVTELHKSRIMISDFVPR